MVKYEDVIPGRVGDSPSTPVVVARLLLGFSESGASEIQRNSDFQRKSVGVPQRC